MEIKSYSIATPFYNKEEKSYSISIDRTTIWHKCYSVALKLSNPFVNSSDNYPVKLSPFARYKAVVVEDKETVADRIVQVESALNKYLIDGVKRRNEIDIEIDTLVDTVVDDEFDIFIDEMHNLEMIREFETYFYTLVNGDKDREDMYAIIEGDYISNRLDQKGIIIDETLDVQEVTKEVDIDIQEGYLTIRDYTFDINILQDQQALQLIRILYGEIIYQDLMTIKENVFDAYMPYTDEFEKRVKVLESVYLEFHDFDDLGYETFLPELEVFDKVYVEKEIPLIERDEFELVITEWNGSYIDINQGYREIIEARGVYLEAPVSEKPKEIQGVYMNEQESGRVELDIVSGALLIDSSERLTEELLSSYIDVYESDRIEDEFDSRIFDIYEFERLMEHESVYDVRYEAVREIQKEARMATHIDEFDRSMVYYSTLLDIKQEAEKNTLHEGLLVKDTEDFYRHNEYESFLLELSDADRVVKELEGRYVEMELFELMGIPVYLHEFDEFSRVTLQFEGSINLHDVSERVNNEFYSVYESPDTSSRKAEYAAFDSSIIEQSQKYNDEFFAEDYELYEVDKQREKIITIEETTLFDRDIVIDIPVILEMFNDSDRLKQKDTFIVDLFEYEKDTEVLSTTFDLYESILDNEEIAEIIEGIYFNRNSELSMFTVLEEIDESESRKRTEGVSSYPEEFTYAESLSAVEGLDIYVDESLEADHIYANESEVIFINLDFASRDRLFEAGFTLEFTNSDKVAYSVFFHELEQFNRDKNRMIDSVFEEWITSDIENEFYADMVSIYSSDRVQQTIYANVYHADTVNRAIDEFNVSYIEWTQSERITNEFDSRLVELNKFERLAETSLGVYIELEEVTTSHEMSIYIDEMNEFIVYGDGFDAVINSISEYTRNDEFKASVDEWSGAHRLDEFDISMHDLNLLERINEFKSYIEDWTPFHRLEEKLVDLDLFDEFDRTEKLANIIELELFNKNKILLSVDEELLQAVYDDRSYIWLWHSRPYWWYTWKWYKTK